MPRQNRVTPFGVIIAAPERGTFLGNRGVLHDDEGCIKRPWQVKRWIVCLLEYRGRRRAVMTPGRYTELFFLDEATALAAGHRHCAECRRGRFNAFRTAWRAAHSGAVHSILPTADEIDRRLHYERVAADRSKRSFTAVLDRLPDGVFVTLEDAGPAFLLYGTNLYPWTPGGYSEPRSWSEGATAAVLTPPSTVAAIRGGFAPDVHPSAGR